MNRKSPVCVFGGDARMLSAAEALRKAGRKVLLCGFENAPEGNSSLPAEQALEEAGDVVFPLPASRDGVQLFAPFAADPIWLDDAMAEKLCGHRVYCGASAQLPQTPAWKKLNITDYYTNETLLQENARITAEAALFEAMGALPDTLYRTRCMVSGYGRVGKALTALLRGMGAPVTVAARRPEDREQAQAMGAQAVSFDDAMPPCDVVFNTVPHLVFPEKLPPETKLYIEIASKAGTVPAAVGTADYIRAAALPGKYAPRAAGYAIAAALISEEECL